MYDPPQDGRLHNRKCGLQRPHIGIVVCINRRASFITTTWSKSQRQHTHLLTLFRLMLDSVLGGAFGLVFYIRFYFKLPKTQPDTFLNNRDSILLKRFCTQNEGVTQLKLWCRLSIIKTQDPRRNQRVTFLYNHIHTHHIYIHIFLTKHMQLTYIYIQHFIYIHKYV